AAPTVHYSVAFNQPNGLPANVDKIIANAGGTIAERLPEIGGVGVVSDNPNFLANLAKESSVKAADVAIETSLAPTLWTQPEPTSSTNNGRTCSTTRPVSRAQPGPVP